MAVKIPGEAIATSAPGNDDIQPATVEFLRSLSLLPTSEDAQKNGAGAAFTGAPDSVAVIEAGATAASKWWSAAIAGGAGLVIARLTTVWDSLGSNSWNQPFALLALGLVFAATAGGIAYLLGSDVRGRSAASVAAIEARRALAVAMIEEAGRAAGAAVKPPGKTGTADVAEGAVAPTMHVLSPIEVQNSTKAGPAAEQAWKALMVRQTGQTLDFYLVKGAESQWVSAGDVVF